MDMCVNTVRISRVAALMVVLVGCSLMAQPSHADEFRGFWADAFHPGFKSTSEINAMVARAVQGNYNAIVAEVLAYKDTSGSGHGAYWNSAIIPKANDISGGIDPLAYLVQQAHAQGIEVHAWIVAYRVSTSWPPSGNTLLANHPEWLMVQRDDMDMGPVAFPDGKYVLDPGSPEVQQYLVDIVRELVTNYAIDGINWDYIRYIYTDGGYPADESYAQSTLARFQNLTGYEGVPFSTGNSSWNDFRRRTIDELVRRCRAEIASITTNPRQPVVQSADLICFGSAPGSFSSSDAYALHQNWRYWMQMGWLDAGMPMNYKAEQFYPTSYRSWVDAAVAWSYGRHMYCGQANYLNSKANSITQLQYVRDAGAQGSMNYSYVGTADDNLDGSWENDWTWYPYVAANHFTTPVATPDLPWRDPAQATEGTLWGRVIDAGTGEPFDEATVQVSGQSPVLTDGNGYYVVTRLPATMSGQAYTVSVTGGSYPTDVESGVMVYAGDVSRYDVLIGIPPLGFGDMDSDGDIDLNDYLVFQFCLLGPESSVAQGLCEYGDHDGDLDVDVADFAEFQRLYTGSAN